MTDYELDMLRVMNRIADAFEGIADALRNIGHELDALNTSVGGDLAGAVEGVDAAIVNRERSK